MTSAILELDLDIDCQTAVCLQEATHKLYAHDALNAEDNTHDLMNTSHSSKQMF